MPAGGFFFDNIIRQDAIDEEKLNPEDNLEEFGAIAQQDLDWFDRETAAAAAKGWGPRAGDQHAADDQVGVGDRPLDLRGVAVQPWSRAPGDVVAGRQSVHG